LNLNQRGATEMAARRTGLPALAIALLLTVFAYQLFNRFFTSQWAGLLAWVLAVNLVTLLVFVYDKRIAGSRATRVPENILLLLVALGGGFGAWYGIKRVRHKSRKREFQFRFGVAVVVSLLILAVYVLTVTGAL